MEAKGEAEYWAALKNYMNIYVYHHYLKRKKREARDRNMQFKDKMHGFNEIGLENWWIRCPKFILVLIFYLLSLSRRKIIKLI